jgi:Concanavalin A-like lectin/glucanases superfamily
MPFTISGWFYSSDPQKELQTVLSMGRSEDGTAFNFGYNFPGKPNSCYFGVIATKPLGIEYDLSAAGWHFIAATVDDKSMKFFVDGYIVEEERLSPADATQLQANLVNSSEPISIGRELTLDRNFIGILDNVSMYSRVLSQAEIVQLWKATTPGK